MIRGPSAAETLPLPSFGLFDALLPPEVEGRETQVTKMMRPALKTAEPNAPDEFVKHLHWV